MGAYYTSSYNYFIDVGSSSYIVGVGLIMSKVTTSFAATEIGMADTTVKKSSDGKTVYWSSAEYSGSSRPWRYENTVYFLAM